MGRLIPAGTGLDFYRSVRLVGEEEEELAALESVVLPPSPYEEAERALDLFRNDTDGDADTMEDLGAE